jgi:hypothetical protein
MVLVILSVVTNNNSTRGSNVSQNSPTLPTESNTNQQTITSASTPDAQTQAPTVKTDSNLVAESTNDLNCKNIAYQAASLDDQENTKLNEKTIIDSTYYNQSLGQCFYVVTVLSDGGVINDEEIKRAPNDEIIAYCESYPGYHESPAPPPICWENPGAQQKQISQQRLQQLESFYLSN